MTTLAIDLSAYAAPVEASTPRRHFWTTREEKILRDHYPAGGINACELLAGPAT